MTAIIALPRWLSGPKKHYITRSGGAYTPDDVALRFALSLRIYDTADSIRAVAFNLVNKVCLEHQPNMKRLARESDDAKVFDAAIKIVTRVCELMRIGGPEPFQRNELEGPEADPRYIQFTPEQLHQMGQMYVGGASMEQVSKRYGISPSVVSRRLKAMGVEVRPKGNQRKITDEVISRALALRAEGMPWKQVSKVVGYKDSSITAEIRYRRAQEAKAHE